MKDSIKKQFLPDLAGINARLYESLSFYIQKRKDQLSPGHDRRLGLNIPDE